jgi:hypothetical protein
MSTGEWHLPDRPNAVLGSVPEQDLNAMIHQYSALLNRVARSVTRDAGDAEDVVQETFLRALRHHNKIAVGGCRPGKARSTGQGKWAHNDRGGTRRIAAALGTGS